MVRTPAFAAALFAAAALLLPTVNCAEGLKLDLKLVPHASVPQRPATDARTEIIAGELASMAIVDRRNGASWRHYVLREADGTRVPVRWLPVGAAVPGAVVQIEGRRGGEAFFVDRATTLRAPEPTFRDAPPPDAQRHTGMLEVLHADHFDSDRCEMHFVLRRADGSRMRLDMTLLPEPLAEGNKLTVVGQDAPDALSTVPSEITIEGTDETDAADRVSPQVSGTTQVLVILIKYADTTTEPYAQATVASTVFSGTSSVANYFREASYGRHMLAGTVTPWLTASFAKPTTCDYSRVSTEALRLAGNAGYNTSSYQKYVYVFPTLPGCGWAGLGGGANAWINQSASLLVIGHELGHTFGLGHSSSLRCTSAGVTTSVDGTCTRSEYGDGYAIMGNSRGHHFVAPHKVQLGYLASSEYRVHGAGTATYTLAPYETPGGTTYAIKIPASPTRTYWLEWRQPVGFDASAGTGITAGALVHGGAPFEWSCGTCLLDMTPVTGSSFDDAALPVGRTFTDATANVSLSVLASTATSLTVSVTAPTRPSYADVPTTHSAYTAIETLAWHGIAVECDVAPLRYCPERAVTRAEAAAFLERAKRGANYAFTATGTVFADVPLTQWAAKYIEQFYADSITSGCAGNPLRYCPDALLTRTQMAPLMLRARWGSTFNPGTATGTIFADVPPSYPFAAWIERLYQYGITNGCAANTYCPLAQVTRAQLALFIQRAFALAAPPQ